MGKSACQEALECDWTDRGQKARAVSEGALECDWTDRGRDGVLCESLCGAFQKALEWGRETTRDIQEGGSVRANVGSEWVCGPRGP